jgi:hypothetical protein
MRPLQGFQIVHRTLKRAFAPAALFASSLPGRAGMIDPAPGEGAAYNSRNAYSFRKLHLILVNFIAGCPTAATLASMCQSGRERRLAGDRDGRCAMEVNVCRQARVSV